ncbi:MAG: hypothetical protein N2489_09225 [Clostridia bacterium]|nr:hypothetical protein [Clostridia bacterium]
MRRYKDPIRRYKKEEFEDAYTRLKNSIIEVGGNYRVKEEIIEKKGYTGALIVVGEDKKDRLIGLMVDPTARAEEKFYTLLRLILVAQFNLSLQENKAYYVNPYDAIIGNIRTFTAIITETIMNGGEIPAFAKAV